MAPKLPLPRGGKRRVRSSVLHVLALGHYWFTHFSAGTTFAGAGLPRGRARRGWARRRDDAMPLRIGEERQRSPGPPQPAEARKRL
jgi:hypothetical protein